MFKTTIDLHSVVSAFVSIVQEVGPDHKASNGDSGNGCTYFVTDGHRLKPVCIVGRYLSNLGVLRATVSEGCDPEYPEGEGACIPGAVLWHNIEEFGVTFSDEAKQFMRDAQTRQDDGETWADAVRGAVEETKRHAIAAVEASMQPLVNLAETLPTHVQVSDLAPWEQELLSGNSNHESLVALALNDSEVIQHMRESHSIYAIKRLRTIGTEAGLNSGLKQAKDAVEDYRVQAYKGQPPF